MKASIHDPEALASVSPAALSAYARSLGWAKADAYGEHSDIYVAEGLPEIILPRTQNIADYASVVSQLMGLFGDAADIDALSLYRDLVTADRDVNRLRVGEGGEDGSLPVSSGVDLMVGARDMVLAAACSLQDQRPVYRMGANRDATEYLNQVRLGQTEQGSFVVTMLTPVIPPPMDPALIEDFEPIDAPIGRRMTKHLESALAATRRATELANTGNADAFREAVSQGVSANFCEAIVTLLEPFPTLDTSFSWARTRPVEAKAPSFRFATADAPILQEAARSLRAREPRQETPVFGVVRRLQRGEHETDGAISLMVSIDGRNQTLSAVLSQSEFEQAIEAHRNKEPVVLTGDLERVGQLWKLLNPRILDVIKGDEDPVEES